MSKEFASKTQVGKGKIASLNILKVYLSAPAQERSRQKGLSLLRDEEGSSPRQECRIAVQLLMAKNFHMILWVRQ